MKKRNQPNKTEPLSAEAKEVTQEFNAKRKFLSTIAKATAYSFPLIYLSKIDSVVADEKGVQNAVRTPKDLSSPTTVKSTPAGLEEQPQLIRSGRVPDLPGVRYQQVSPSSGKPLPKLGPK